VDNLEVQQPLRDFKDLNIAEKVRAILGTVEEPVSKDFALKLGGINYKELDETGKKLVDTTFTGDSVVETKTESEQRYMLNEAGRLKLEGEVNMSTVHGVIADVLWKELGLDETSSTS